MPLIEGLTEDTIDSDLPPLQFPETESGVWNVFITVANSPVEIWVRIVGPQYSVSKNLSSIALHFLCIFLYCKIVHRHYKKQ